MSRARYYDFTLHQIEKAFQQYFPQAAENANAPREGNENDTVARQNPPQAAAASASPAAAAASAAPQPDFDWLLTFSPSDTLLNYYGKESLHLLEEKAKELKKQKKEIKKLENEIRELVGTLNRELFALNDKKLKSGDNNNTNTATQPNNIDEKKINEKIRKITVLKDKLAKLEHDFETENEKQKQLAEKIRGCDQLFYAYYHTNHDDPPKIKEIALHNRSLHGDKLKAIIKLTKEIKSNAIEIMELSEAINQARETDAKNNPDNVNQATAKARAELDAKFRSGVESYQAVQQEAAKGLNKVDFQNPSKEYLEQHNKIIERKIRENGSFDRHLDEIAESYVEKKLEEMNNNPSGESANALPASQQQYEGDLRNREPTIITKLQSSKQKLENNNKELEAKLLTLLNKEEGILAEIEAVKTRITKNEKILADIERKIENTSDDLVKKIETEKVRIKEELQKELILDAKKNEENINLAKECAEMELRATFPENTALYDEIKKEAGNRNDPNYTEKLTAAITKRVPKESIEKHLEEVAKKAVSRQFEEAEKNKESKLAKELASRYEALRFESAEEVTRKLNTEQEALTIEVGELRQSLTQLNNQKNNCDNAIKCFINEAQKTADELFLDEVKHQIMTAIPGAGIKAAEILRKMADDILQSHKEMGISPPREALILMLELHKAANTLAGPHDQKHLSVADFQPNYQQALTKKQFEDKAQLFPHLVINKNDLRDVAIDKSIQWDENSPFGYRLNNDLIIFTTPKELMDEFIKLYDQHNNARSGALNKVMGISDKPGAQLLALFKHVAQNQNSAESIALNQALYNIQMTQYPHASDQEIIALRTALGMADNKLTRTQYTGINVTKNEAANSFVFSIKTDDQANSDTKSVSISIEKIKNLASELINLRTDIGDLEKKKLLEYLDKNNVLSSTADNQGAGNYLIEDETKKIWFDILKKEVILFYIKQEIFIQAFERSQTIDDRKNIIQNYIALAQNYGVNNPDLAGFNLSKAPGACAELDIKFSVFEKIFYGKFQHQKGEYQYLSGKNYHDISLYAKKHPNSQIAYAYHLAEYELVKASLIASAAHQPIASVPLGSASSENVDVVPGSAASSGPAASASADARTPSHPITQDEFNELYRLYEVAKNHPIGKKEVEARQLRLDLSGLDLTQVSFAGRDMHDVTLTGAVLDLGVNFASPVAAQPPSAASASASGRSAAAASSKKEDKKFLYAILTNEPHNSAAPSAFVVNIRHFSNGNEGTFLQDIFKALIDGKQLVFLMEKNRKNEGDATEKENTEAVCVSYKLTEACKLLQSQSNMKGPIASTRLSQLLTFATWLEEYLQKKPDADTATIKAAVRNAVEPVKVAGTFNKEGPLGGIDKAIIAAITLAAGSGHEPTATM